MKTLDEAIDLFIGSKNVPLKERIETGLKTTNRFKEIIIEVIGNKSLAKLADATMLRVVKGGDPHREIMVSIAIGISIGIEMEKEDKL